MAEFKIGRIIELHPDKKIMEDRFRLTHDLGMNSLQILSYFKQHRTDENAEHIVMLCKKYDIEIATLWTGWTPLVKGMWSFYLGQQTLGLVPVAFRANRLEEMRGAIPFAKKIGAPFMTSHVGYLPENPYDDNYIGTVVALKVLCTDLKNAGMGFNFETGQETPTTLLRAIEDIGTENVGLNLDPANLISYGKANPCDAMDTIGDYVRGTHIKDAVYPTNPRDTGGEVPLGQGKVDFPKLIKLLNEHKYKGHFNIEREILEGEEYYNDVKNAMNMIKTEYDKYNWDF